MLDICQVNCIFMIREQSVIDFELQLLSSEEQTLGKTNIVNGSKFMKRSLRYVFQHTIWKYNFDQCIKLRYIGLIKLQSHKIFF
jgi:hypothetical protein